MPALIYLIGYKAIFRPEWDRFGVILEHFWGQHGVTLAPRRNHFGIVLASSWCRFVIVLTHLEAFWALLAPM